MRTKLFTTAAAAVAALSLAGAAQAMTFVSTGGNAQADINLSGNTLTVALSNLVASDATAAGEISGIQIYFDTSLNSGGGFTQAGQLVQFDYDAKTKVGTATLVSGDPTRWAPTVSTNELHLTALTGTQPEDLIAGAGPNYVYGGTSNNFNPNIQGTGTFTLSLLGDLPTTVRSVVFEYGTGPDSTSGGSCTADCGGFGGGGGVPEPASWTLMLLGFSAMGAVLRRRRLAPVRIAQRAKRR
jgi:hypothetical protein